MLHKFLYKLYKVIQIDRLLPKQRSHRDIIITHPADDQRFRGLTPFLKGFSQYDFGIYRKKQQEKEHTQKKEKTANEIEDHLPSWALFWIRISKLIYFKLFAWPI